ncbi:unnamed protein product [Effrenium voratum]|uniref:Uncharacterized protein n=1 Tax=Effrenium voratum TaxID=2562239 RepID=A0AA36NIA4_9DINO|nr:unnamed protein product [Effrenium voratum]
MFPGPRTAGKSKHPAIFATPSKEDLLSPSETPERPASTSGLRRQVSNSRDAPRELREFEERPRSAPGRRKAHRAKNPFIEYDAREKRLNQERKWLQEAPDHMEQRRTDLRLGALLRHLDVRDDSDERLYENRTFYGPHSMAMKARQRPRKEPKEPKEKKEKKEAGRKAQEARPALALKRLGQES